MSLEPLPTSHDVVCDALRNGVERESMPRDAPPPQPAMLRGSSPPRRPPAPPTPSPGSSPPAPWEAIIAQGKAHGYLTVEQINAVFDVLNRDPPADLRPVYDLLSAMGIEVVASADELPVVQPPQTRSDWERKRTRMSGGSKSGTGRQIGRQ